MHLKRFIIDSSGLENLFPAMLLKKQKTYLSKVGDDSIRLEGPSVCSALN